MNGGGPPILILAGTNRPGSATRKVAAVLAGHYAAAGEPADLLSLEELPASAFAGGAYAHKPPEVVALGRRVLDSAGVHVVTPEYNGGPPGVLKYFIDLLKFPESFDGRPVAFTGLAAGRWGAVRSVEQLSQVFAYRNAHQYPPRVFLPGVADLLDEAGRLTDADLDGRLRDQCAGFAAFARRVGAG